MKKVITDILTGADNSSFDNGRVICLLSFLVYFFLAISNAFLGHVWSGMDFAGGVGAMAVGFGINLRLKRETEPPR